jgi:hypothetical protein
MNCIFVRLCESDLTGMLNDCVMSEDSDMYRDLFDDKKQNYFWQEMSYFRYHEVTSWEDREMPTELEIYESELRDIVLVG